MIDWLELQLQDLSGYWAAVNEAVRRGRVSRAAGALEASERRNGGRSRLNLVSHAQEVLALTGAALSLRPVEQLGAATAHERLERRFKAR
ncbi:MAG: hypothetical protein LC808_16410 [Actinobacteria bacterium]|nr:hypothetical protein [Actinomycetota bacterium]